MTDKEKLIDLLEGAESAIYWNSEDKNFIEKIADHLIANGVTFATDNNVGGKVTPVGDKLSATDKDTNVLTNADRIRAMTDEELAAIMIQCSDLDERVGFCKNLYRCELLLGTDDGIPASMCEECLLEWMKQPAEVDNG